jgi:hypothetical protein
MKPFRQNNREKAKGENLTTKVTKQHQEGQVSNSNHARHTIEQRITGDKIAAREMTVREITV